MKNILIFVIALNLSHCVSLHTPSPHFVPSITKKGQVETEFSVGSSLSINAAYSPFQHLSLLANAHSLPPGYASGSQNGAELGLGYYAQKNKCVFGLNGIYGMGSFDLRFSQKSDSLSYTLQTKGVYQKISIQAFLAFTGNSEADAWFSGLSLKANYFMDQFSSLSYSYDTSNEFSGLKPSTSFEPCIFTRNFVTKKLFVTGQGGLNISYDESMYWPTQYLFVRLGIGARW